MTRPDERKDSIAGSLQLTLNSGARGLQPALARGFRIGGYNFQWAWASGFIAGSAAAASLVSPAS